MNQQDQEMMMLLVLIVAGLYAYQRGLLQPYIEKLKTLMSGAGSAVGGGGGGGGAISGEGTCVGTPLTKADRSDRQQYGTDNIPGDPDAYEVTWCGTIGDQGEDLTFKLYGPSHSNDGDCCWCVVHVDKAGTMSAGGEGPHPSSNCIKKKGGTAPAPCYKAVIRPGPIQEGYALVGGQWKLMVSHKGPCGCDETSSTKTGNTLMVRCDGPLTTKCASVKALGATATPAPAPAAAKYAWIPLIPNVSV